MSVNKEESLSADEIRQKLYQTFKSRGLLDSMKTQLRNQLIQELQQPVRTRHTVLRSAHSDSVLATACNSVMIDHLKTIGCEYTLSVFYPECGMSKDKVLSSRDLLQLMKISPHMPLYKAVMSNLQKGQTGFLMTLFTELSDHLHGSVNCDAASQTSAEDAHKESLVEKMQMIEQEYELMRNREERWTSVEVKLTQHRREIEEQSQVELKAQLQHFMDVEITKVKREEQEKSRKEILELRRDMERTHELKSEALVSREKNAIERLQKHQEMEEKEIYTQRQMLLRDIESVRHRETDLKQRTEAFEKSCKFHEEKMKTVEDLLRRRELSVKNTEDSLEQKLKSEVMKYQLELKDDYMKRTEMLTENEKRNKVESVGLQKERAVIEAQAEEHKRTLSEVKQLQMELETLREQMNLLRQQKHQLQEKLDDMRDYSELKRQTLEHQTQIRLIRHQLEEKHEENRRLTQEVSSPSEEQLRLQAELKRLQTGRRRDEEEFETQKNVLHTQLHHEVQKCALLKAQLMECEERTRWMNTHAEEIQLQLKHTQQALENQILLNPKPSLLDPSVLCLNPPDISMDSALFRRATGSDVALCEAGETLRAPRSRVEVPERDSELLSGALARIRQLEIEAERLEDAYRNHQQRATEDASRHRTTTSTSFIKPRVTFTGALDPNQPLCRTPSGDQTPPRLNSPPARRLSSTPVSRPDAHQTHPVIIHERLRKTDTEGPAVMFTDLRTDRQISPIPPADSRDLTSVSSPTMKSTTRDHSSPPRLQQIISSPSTSSSSSQGSSPQPEKISLHDLTDPEPHQECILEKLQDTHTQSCLRDEAVPSSDAREEEERPEEREEERSEQALEIQHEKEAEEEHVTGAATVIGGRDEEPSDVINPLEKYMMILMQGKQEQSPKKESDRESPQEEHLLSGINDDSIDAVSHEEPDEEFW
ncbi:centriole and centriolar satellite protein ofd1 isoform X1 [Triplophysa dalaica]|uniref:centriole and centriolar satellite protein ofd1 isoform X1 n=1 Tax=Triplophysa dalaica TaxID=1582913 RepID=UPI0024DFFEF6|nr:centriole and centriolar satellite protein ofd1 isoform X1 [Triplophysa dalaica]